MSINIFYHQDNTTEEWLDINSDGSATYTRQSDGQRFVRRGPQRKEKSMTVDEAKRRFPEHTEEIDLALAQLAAKKSA